jgi:hypothetical protein
MNVFWKRMSHSGHLSEPSKTHLIKKVNTTACGKVIPRFGVEHEYGDSNYTDCTVCSKAYEKNRHAY